jgi:hypothetical protein
MERVAGRESVSSKGEGEVRQGYRRQQVRELEKGLVAKGRTRV